MQSTKNRILHNAEELFFDHGIANVRLQQIADKTGISVGNLAYHFKNKETIVEAVYEGLMEHISDILMNYNIHSGLKNFDAKFSNLYHFMKIKKFYFVNFWEIKRNYPDVNEKIGRVNNKILMKLRKQITDNVKSGVFKKESYKGDHNLLAGALFLSINSWLPQQLLKEKRIIERDFKNFLWGHLYPHLSEKGIKEFNSL
ncbi:MAG: TetR/AcrR family transcriptional regulator [Ginsengibacter sp.]